MVDCPKRRRANAREYLPEVMAEARAELKRMRMQVLTTAPNSPQVMAEARAELKRMRQAAEEKLALHRKASEEVRVQKQTLFDSSLWG